ncbi:MAG: flagellar motor protein MotD [Steroidobacteraceae bacterium]|nr:flagellar motor protein MotD [Steroidobacteraceae bacterium]
MARKRKHEDHQNHEAWAIPYGDLVTLLLAFFVVMYAISSVNEGKFRVLSDSLQAAFRGSPKSMDPVQMGEKTRGSGADIAVSIVQQAMIDGQPRQMLEAVSVHQEDGKGLGPARQNGIAKENGKLIEVIVPAELAKVADDVERSLATLVDAKLVTVRRHSFWIEVEIRTDILFPSGIAVISQTAVPALQALAKALAPYPNPIRVEGHTDNVPIRTVAFPSNWELSSARAASVVHLLANGGVDARRLSVIGLGEWHPTKPNDSIENRNANRRVLLVILSGTVETQGGTPGTMPDIDRDASPLPAAPVAPVPEPLAIPGEPAVALPTAAAATNAGGTALPPGVTRSPN